MKNWNLIFRRTHLYLGMLLIPWLMVYALSTVLFNHGHYFRQFRVLDRQWLPLWEKDYTIDVPPGNDGLRDTAQRIMREHGLHGAFGVQRQGQRLNINVQNFWQPQRLTYDPARKKLSAEARRSSWIEVLVRLHERTGYGQPGVLNNVWAFMVDLYCITSLVWIGTGLYLWWKLAVTRRWGFVALGGGIGSIMILLATL